MIYNLATEIEKIAGGETIWSCKIDIYEFPGQEFPKDKLGIELPWRIARGYLDHDYDESWDQVYVCLEVSTTTKRIIGWEWDSMNGLAWDYI